MTVFSTRNDDLPRIEHGRDLILEGNAVAENYNYLDYHFASEGRSLRARTYLDEPSSVAIYFLNEDLPRDAAEALRRLPSNVLCYLQKRFGQIEALTNQGYARIWPGE